ncbi:MAG: phosphoribosylamine--glycine ligase [Chthoniobacterales bacterium]
MPQIRFCRVKILIVGGGGREHALAWKIKQSPRVTEVICLPGNGGTANNSHISVSDLIKLRDYAVSEGVDLTVVGPDDALAGGIVDLFIEAGLRVFGPRQAAARLESSKIFAKEFMERHGIPTARSGQFTDPAAARSFASQLGLPVVIKADGLALGKGVIIAQTAAETEDAIHRMMELREFGESGASVVIEEFLTGEECSIHALVDGKSYLLFPGAQDHKRAFDGDAGPNTGGMGTCSPVPILDAAMQERVRREVMDRFIAGIQADGIEFKGMLFPGLMITADGPKVLEFNCRFGDPETQVLLPRLQSDLVDLLEATIDGRLNEMELDWDSRAAVCVVMASGGYPGNYPKGLPISGIADAEASGALVFHAGTQRAGETVVTSGGRVLGVTALAADVKSAREKAYQAVAKIHFDGQFYRQDIGLKSI